MSQYVKIAAGSLGVNLDAPSVIEMFAMPVFM